MQPIALVLYVHHTAADGVAADDARRRVDTVVAPLVDLLVEHPHLRVSVHWTGALLEWMDLHATDLLGRILQLVAQGRLEVLGGPWGSALLPALPERDAIGQVQAMNRWWRAHQDVRPRGIHLPHFGWDPAAARTLARLGLQYTVLEDAQFFPAVAADGYYLTEREGHALAVFAADTRAAQVLLEPSVGRFFEVLALRSRQGVRCVTVALPGERLAAGPDGEAATVWGPQGWLRQLARKLADHAATVKGFTFSTALDRLRPTDRAWPPPSITEPVAVAALGADGAAFVEAIAELGRGHDEALGRAAAFLRAGSWEALLARDAELNRFHKRMLRASLEVLRLRNALREGKGERDPRFLALEEATLALYAGQHAGASVVGVAVGAHDARLRAWCHQQLLRAEQLVAHALGEGDRLRWEQVDYDCDGRAEVIVRSPHLAAVVAPSAGGALVELASWQWGNFLNARSRRDESWLAELEHAAGLPRLVDAAEAEAAPIDAESLGDPRRPEPLVVVEDDLAERVITDRHLRLSFVDRFLGADATRENVALGRFPEAGDFVGAEYQVLQLEGADQGAAVLSMARDGNVTDGGSVRLVRLVKRYVFQRDLPMVDVRYEIGNRYHEPVRSRFGVEVNLCLDGAPESYLVAGGRRCGLDEDGEVVDATDIALVDPARGWRLVIQLQQPARLWFQPLTTAAPGPDGLAQAFLGTSLLFWWPVELWGLERRRIDLTLALEG